MKWDDSRFKMLQFGGGSNEASGSRMGNLKPRLIFIPMGYTIIPLRSFKIYLGLIMPGNSTRMYGGCSTNTQV